MKSVQSSDSAARVIVENPTADSVESSNSKESAKEAKAAEMPVENSAAETKGNQQMAQENKAAKDLEGSVRQHELQNSLPTGGVFLAPGKPLGQKSEGSDSEVPETPGNPPATKMRSNPGTMIYADNGIAIFKKGGNHTVFGENKDRIPGNPRDGVNGVYVEDSSGKPQVIIFDKNGKDGGVGVFSPSKYTPQQIVRMWEEERKENPKATNEEIRLAVVARRDREMKGAKTAE